MSGSLGIKIGTTGFAAAAVAEQARAGASGRCAPRLETIQHQATLIMTPGTAPTLARLGSGARPVQSGLAITGFVDRVGDPIDLIAADGSAHRPEDLVAGAVHYLTRYSAGAFTGAPAIAATYPSHWKSHDLQALREALDRMDMTGVDLVDEVGSILARVDATRGLPPDGIVVVYDLGGNGLSISLARRTEQIGTTIRSAEFGGSHIDYAIFRHVLSGLDGELGDIDLGDPALVAPLSELRLRCRQAKETLSAETVAVVEVELGRVRHEVRIVRSELEELIREPVVDSAAFIREALHANDIDAEDVRAVVLAGGAAATPLVAEMLSAEFHVPVIGEADSALTSAQGAALIASSSVSVADSPPQSVPEPDSITAPEAPESDPYIDTVPSDPPLAAVPPNPITAPEAPESDPYIDTVPSDPPLAAVPPKSVSAQGSGGGEKVRSRRKRALLAAAVIVAIAAAIVGVVAIVMPNTLTQPDPKPEQKPAVSEQVSVPRTPPSTPLPYPTRRVS
ncbi:Hsp70 family protein [Nocardia sp. CA-129566]|uniref:Hsp70 family protein n=1 Tax=Nocardia sp. CA-129566 TaxID=3239976 RepID=UPI003D9552B0